MNTYSTVEKIFNTRACVDYLCLFKTSSTEIFSLMSDTVVLKQKTEKLILSRDRESGLAPLACVRHQKILAKRDLLDKERHTKQANADGVWETQR